MAASSARGARVARRAVEGTVFGPPRPLLDPPGLATAAPAHSWLSGRPSAFP
jgi:hypothetical protein